MPSVKEKLRWVLSVFKFFLKKPGSCITAILFNFSLADIAKKALPKMKSIITIGSKKVESKNVLFLTLVMYSLFMMSKILFIVFVLSMVSSEL